MAGVPTETCQKKENFRKKQEICRFQEKNRRNHRDVTNRRRSLISLYRFLIVTSVT